MLRGSNSRHSAKHKLDGQDIVGKRRWQRGQRDCKWGQLKSKTFRGNNFITSKLWKKSRWDESHRIWLVKIWHIMTMMGLWPHWWQEGVLILEKEYFSFQRSEMRRLGFSVFPVTSCLDSARLSTSQVKLIIVPMPLRLFFLTVRELEGILSASLCEPLASG